MKLKGVRPKELGVVMELAAWREQEAQTKNVPRNRVLRDESIFELARLQPATLKDLSKARSISNGFERSAAGSAILDAIIRGKEIPRASLPKLAKDERAKAPSDVVELLKVLLKRQCEEYDVAPKLIASTQDLEDIARDDAAEVPAMSGWRFEIYGELALRIKNGELALRINNNAVDIVDLKN